MKFLYAFLCLVGAAFAEERKIYIIVNHELHSTLLKNELTRDWTTGKHLNSECYALDNMRTELASKVVIVDINSYSDRVKYRIVYPETFPSYRLGEHVDIISFPKETFYTSSWPLRTVYALQHNINVDEIAWRDHCHSLIINSKANYANAVISWMFSHKQEEASSILTYENDDQDETVQKFAQKYKSEVDFPNYVRPQLPKCPILPLPWQNTEAVLIQERIIP